MHARQGIQSAYASRTVTKVSLHVAGIVACTTPDQQRFCCGMLKAHENGGRYCLQALHYIQYLAAALVPYTKLNISSTASPSFGC